MLDFTKKAVEVLSFSSKKRVATDEGLETDLVIRLRLRARLTEEELELIEPTYAEMFRRHNDRQNIGFEGNDVQTTSIKRKWEAVGYRLGKGVITVMACLVGSASLKITDQTAAMTWTVEAQVPTSTAFAILDLVDTSDTTLDIDERQLPLFDAAEEAASHASVAHAVNSSPLGDLTVAQLKSRAKELGIEGASSLSKTKLIQQIQTTEASFRVCDSVQIM